MWVESKYLLISFSREWDRNHFDNWLEKIKISKYSCMELYACIREKLKEIVSGFYTYNFNYDQFAYLYHKNLLAFGKKDFDIE